MIRPVAMLETSRPPTSASDIRPARVGDMPRAIWKYCERKTVEPNIARPTMTLAKTARLVVRSRNSRSGMIGSRTRDSVWTAAASRTTPSRHHPGGGEREPVELVTRERHPDQQHRDAAGDQAGAAR